MAENLQYFRLGETIVFDYVVFTDGSSPFGMQSALYNVRFSAIVDASITYEVIPEPSSVLFLLGASGALILLRLRRAA